MRGVRTVHAATCADDSMTATWESPRVGRIGAQMLTAVPIPREALSSAGLTWRVEDAEASIGAQPARPVVEGHLKQVHNVRKSNRLEEVRSQPASANVTSCALLLR